MEGTMTFHKRKREIREILRRKKSCGRAFALFLSLALCVESAPLTALAAQPDVEVSVSGAEAPKGSGESKDGGQSLREQQEADTPEQAESGENGGQNPGAGEETGEGKSPDGSGESAEGEATEPSDGGAQEPESGGETQNPGGGEGEPQEPGEGGGSGLSLIHI